MLPKHRLFDTNQRKKSSRKGHSLKECKRDLLRTLNTFLQGKADEEPLPRPVYVPFYLNKVKDKHERQIMHTYALIETNIFKEATK